MHPIDPEYTVFKRTMGQLTGPKILARRRKLRELALNVYMLRQFSAKMSVNKYLRELERIERAFNAL